MSNMHVCKPACVLAEHMQFSKIIKAYVKVKCSSVGLSTFSASFSHDVCIISVKFRKLKIICALSMVKHTET